MKRFFIAVALIAASFSIFAQSVEKYKAAHREGAEYRKAVPNPATFAEVQAKVKEIWAKHGLNDASAEGYAFACGVYHYNQRFLKEAYAQAKAKGNVYTVFAISSFRNSLGISDNEVLDELIKYIDNPLVRKTKMQQRAIEMIIKAAPYVEVKKAKATLEKLNRILSPYLIGSDKGFYENMVAKIRTALATY